MIVVIDHNIEIDTLARALRQGGYTLRSKPGGIFELTQVTRGTPLCSKCDKPAQVAVDGAHLCSNHYLPGAGS